MTYFDYLIYTDGFLDYKTKKITLYKYSSGTRLRTVPLSKNVKDFNFLIITILSGGASQDIVLSISSQTNKRFSIFGTASWGQTTKDNLLTYICEGDITINSDFESISINNYGYNDANFTPTINQVLGFR